MPNQPLTQLFHTLNNNCKVFVLINRTLTRSEAKIQAGLLSSNLCINRPSKPFNLTTWVKTTVLAVGFPPEHQGRNFSPSQDLMIALRLII